MSGIISCIKCKNISFFFFCKTNLYTFDINSIVLPYFYVRFMNRWPGKKRKKRKRSVMVVLLQLCCQLCGCLLVVKLTHIFFTSPLFFCSFCSYCMVNAVQFGISQAQQQCLLISQPLLPCLLKSSGVRSCCSCYSASVNSYYLILLLGGAVVHSIFLYKILI